MKTIPFLSRYIAQLRDHNLHSQVLDEGGAVSMIQQPVASPRDPAVSSPNSVPPVRSELPSATSDGDPLAGQSFEREAGGRADLSSLRAETREIATNVAMERFSINNVAGYVVTFGFFSLLGGMMTGLGGAAVGIVYGAIMGWSGTPKIFDPAATGAAIGAAAGVLGILYATVRAAISEYKSEVKELSSDSWQGFLEGLWNDLGSGSDPEKAINWLVSNTEKQKLFRRELRTPVLCVAVEFLDPSRAAHSGAVVTACKFAVELPASAQGYRILQLAAALLEQGRIHDDYRGPLLDSLLNASARRWQVKGETSGLDDFLGKLFVVSQRDLTPLDPRRQLILQFIMAKSPNSDLAQNAEEALRALPVDGVLD